MFKFVRNDGEEVRAVFRYLYETVPANPYKEKSRPHSRPVTTTCVLLGDKDRVISEGEAHLHPKDNPCYFQGRKYALRRALANGDIPTDERTRAWDAFLDMQNVKH